MDTTGIKKAAFLGIDLGGSNSMAIAFDAEYSILARDKMATKAQEGYSGVIARLIEQCKRIEAEVSKPGYELKGIGLAVPGIVSPGGLLRNAPNLGWTDVSPLKDIGRHMERDLNYVLLNDVNAGLLGEMTRLESVPGCTISYFCGTGIGGAIAYGGELLTGSNGGAGEVGHMSVRRGGRKCGCGNCGCLEAYIGKKALNDKIRKYLKSGKNTLLKKIIDYDLNETPVKSSSLKKAYKKEDPFTVYLMRDYYVTYLAQGIGQAVNFINPDLVLLGGGMMEALGKKLLPYIRERLPAYCMNTIPELRLTELEDLAGPTGAASMVMEGIQSGALNIS